MQKGQVIMERKWTDSQMAAINSDSTNLLVSAAAGSGKTSVLTERILKKILGGADISRMVVVTFTKAAANELKSRISSSLSDALIRDPKNKILARQIASLPSARISTVDSFCFNIVKRNFDKLGLSCDVRVADTAEIKLLFKKTMDALFDELYDNETLLTNFREFTDAFINDRDDNLPDVFIEIYNSLSSTKDGIGFIKKSRQHLIDEKDLPFLETRAGIYLSEYINKFINHFYPPSVKGAALYCDGNAKQIKYYNDFTNIVRILGDMKKALSEKDYDACAAAAATYTPINMKGGPSFGNDDEEAYYKKLRDNFKKDIDNLNKKTFIYREADIKKSNIETAQVLDTLYSLLSVFEKRITDEKRRRNVIDFADVERYALSLLCDGDAPSQYAKEYSMTLDEIYIDEYQDINEVQDTIFRMVSLSCKRFMVGDIKQSIYGFRGSDPSIFAGYRNSYSEAPDTADRKIFLSENFRCARSIVDFTNAVFSHIMNLCDSGINYEKGDELVYSLDRDAPALPVELIMLNKNGDSPSEAEYVAERIKELIASGYKPSDIAILFRSPKNAIAPFEEALSNINVPYHSNISRDFFENPEILLALCLLNTIDNPRRDIYLAGALRSPIFGFTLDDLAIIRKKHKDGSLYDALCEYKTENEYDEKCVYFFSWLEHMRKFARSKPIDKLIWHIFTNTSILAVSRASENGEIRWSNLMQLYEHARKFESSSFKGLYNFILYVNEIIESDSTLEDAKANSEAAPTVKLLSVHASKGLEFKVVFLCRSDAAFSNKDATSNIIIDPYLGCSMKLGDKSGFGKFNTALRNISQLMLSERAKEEEMRLLYVALTRAKERLFITSSFTNSDNIIDECDFLAKGSSPYTITNLKSYATMIITALRSHANTDPCWRMVIPSKDTIIGSIDAQKYSQEDEAQCETPDYETCRKLIKDVFSYKYPYETLVGLPSKLTVSKLHPDILDDSERCDTPPKMLEIPDFIESADLPTAAEKGIATHLFLQFCDFDYIDQYGVEAEADRLSACKFISSRARTLISINNLKRFFASGLYAEIRQARECYREFRFNVYFPASEFTSQSKNGLKDEKILVQGVIDCFIVTKKGIKIIDYKTDNFSPVQKKNIQKCREIMRERHFSQLNYYKRAIESLFKMPVYQVALYSLSLGEEITIKELSHNA